MDSNISKVFGKPNTLHKVEIFVPSTINLSFNGFVHTEPLHPVFRVQVISRITRTLSEMFGGATQYESIGAWLNDSDLLINEDVTVVYALYRTITLEQLTIVKHLANEVKNAFNQDCVLVTIDNEGWLI